MFRKRDIIVIRDRRRMSGVQMLATGAALLGLLAAAPHLFQAGVQDFQAARAQISDQSATEWCTPARIQGGLCAPSLFDPNRYVRVAGTTSCHQENGKLTCTTCEPDTQGNQMVCRPDSR
jgi:hypothetical protein